MCIRDRLKQWHHWVEPRSKFDRRSDDGSELNRDQRLNGVGATQITAELGSKSNLTEVQSWTTLVQRALNVYVYVFTSICLSVCVSVCLCLSVSLSLCLSVHLCWVLGCVHIDTSPSTRIRVPVNTSLHVFQWWPFTLIRVLYVLFRLPVNFTHTSSFSAGHVFIQPIWSKQHKINLIYTGHGAYLTSELTSLFNCLSLGVRD